MGNDIVQFLPVVSFDSNLKNEKGGFPEILIPKNPHNGFYMIFPCEEGEELIHKHYNILKKVNLRKNLVRFKNETFEERLENIENTVGWMGTGFSQPSLFTGKTYDEMMMVR